MILGNTHVHYVDVTFDLLDATGRMYLPGYMVLADRARRSALESLGCSARELWADGLTLAVREVSSEHLLPVFGDAKLAVLSQLTPRSERSLTVAQRFVSRRDLPQLELNGSFVDGSVHADASTTICRTRTELACTNLAEDGPSLLPWRLVEACRTVASASGFRAPVQPMSSRALG